LLSACLALSLPNQAAQATTTAPSELIVPAGVHRGFHAAVQNVATALQSGDFERAARLRKWLPGDVITVEYDDRKVPAKYKRKYREGFTKALREWASVPSGPRFSEEPNALLRVTFEPELAESEVPGTPLGATVFFYDKATPRAELVIGLVRTNRRTPTIDTEVQNETMAAIANLIGLAPNPLFGFASSRTDLSVTRPIGIFPGDMTLAQANLKLLRQLDFAIEKKTSLKLGKPSANFHSDLLDAGVVNEGDRANFTVQLTNTGTGTLIFRAGTDCGCVIPPPPAELAPGQSVLVKPGIDTKGYSGEINQRVVFYTNDPEHPVKNVNLRVRSRPQFRWIAPGGFNIALDDAKPSFDFLLLTPPGAKLDPSKARLNLIEGQVTAVPWQGEIDDPELNEPKRSREGYRFTVELDPATINGRATGEVLVPVEAVQSDGKPPVASTLRRTFNVQRGIVASPSDVYFGDLESGRTALLELSKPIPFQIKAAKSTNPVFRLDKIKDTGKTHLYRVTYLGGGRGDVSGQLEFTTDDPKQPVIRVAVLGVEP